MRLSAGSFAFLSLVTFALAALVALAYFWFVPEMRSLLSEVKSVEQSVSGKLEAEQIKELDRLNKLNIARQAEMRQQVEIFKMNEKLIKQLKEVVFP